MTSLRESRENLPRELLQTIAAAADPPPDVLEHDGLGRLLHVCPARACQVDGGREHLDEL